MRISYYKFPDEIPESVLLENGCYIITKNGDEILADSIPNDKRHLVDHIDHTVSGKISWIKKMMKQYGGIGWTEHIERDGGCFEITEIKLTGNNSQFKYNHHL